MKQHILIALLALSGVTAAGVAAAAPEVPTGPQIEVYLSDAAITGTGHITLSWVANGAKAVSVSCSGVKALEEGGLPATGSKQLDASSLNSVETGHESCTITAAYANGGAMAQTAALDFKYRVPKCVRLGLCSPVAAN